MHSSHSGYGANNELNNLPVNKGSPAAAPTPSILDPEAMPRNRSRLPPPLSTQPSNLQPGASNTAPCLNSMTNTILMLILSVLLHFTILSSWDFWPIYHTGIVFVYIDTVIDDCHIQHDRECSSAFWFSCRYLWFCITSSLVHHICAIWHYLFIKAIRLCTFWFFLIFSFGLFFNLWTFTNTDDEIVI